jgi:ankyrin repeat protein
MDADIYQLARNGEYSELAALKQTGVDLNMVNEFGENILHVAITYKKPEIVSLAILSSVQVNKQTKKERLSPLHLACETKQFEVCKQLIEAGADIDLCDDIGRQPLWYACWLPKGDYGIMELLFQHGANPEHIDKNGMSPLSFAKAQTKQKLIELIRTRNT